MEFDRIKEVLRRILKDRKITYRQLGNQIGMSESAVKKMFLAKDCSLNRILKICSVLGISVEELVAAGSDVPFNKIEFTLEVQNYFLKNMDCFYFFCKIVYERQSVESIQAESGLNTRRIRTFIQNLARLQLINLNSDGTVRLPSREVTFWEDKGPLLQRIKKDWSKQIVEEATAGLTGIDQYLVLQTLQLRRESIREFRESLGDLVTQYQKQSSREVALSRDMTFSHRLMIALAPGSFIGKID